MPHDDAESWLHRGVDWLIRWRLPCLTVALVLTVAAFVPASRLDFDQSIESLYARDNPHLRDFLESKRLFGGDEFVIVAYTDPELLTEAGQTRLKQLAERIQQVPGVQEDSVRNLAGVIQGALFLPESQKRKVRELFRGILIGEDEQTTAVMGRLLPADKSPISRGETIRRVRLMADNHQPRAYVVGEPVQVHDMFRYVEEDGRVLGWASTGLLVLVIFLLFRSFRWVLLPFLVVQVTLLWTKAALVVGQLRLSMVSSMLDSLVTIISVATVVHVTLCFRELRTLLSREAALTETFRMLAPAIFWTCATTASGFAVQLSSSIHPVQSFGIMMTLGSMLVLVAVAVVLPSGILIGDFGTEPRPVWGAALLSGSLGRIIHWVEGAPRRLAAVCLLSVLLALSGFFFLRVETDFSKNFRAGSPIVESLNIVETHLGGAGTWEVNFPAPQGELTLEYLAQVRRLAAQLRELRTADDSPAVTKVLAITDGVDMIPEIPFLTKTLGRKLGLLQTLQPDFVSGLYNADQGRMRIMLRALERQPSDHKLRIIEEVKRLATAEFQEASTAGLFVLLTFLIESLLNDQWVSFILAGICITGMMALAFRSLTIGFISLVPNVLPIILVIGTMGWLNLPINIATAMITTVSMGLTIDSSIHYLSGFQRAQKRGLDFYAALRETHQGVGSALVYANIALVSGFLVLTLSNFIPLVYFGILVSLAMFGGLIGNLVLLPLLLRWTRHRL